MKKLLIVIEKIMDNIARYTLAIFFTVMFIAGLVIKGMYNFNDSPYFEITTIYDVVMFIVIFSLVTVIYIKREWIQTHLNYKMCCVLFLIVSMLFIWQVPLTPFSDMAAVYEGALNFAKMDWVGMLDNDYWNIFPGNIRLSVFWGMLILPFPKTLATFKVLNAVMLYVIIALTRELAREYNVKFYNIVYLFLLTFSPVFLFINSVYFDMPLILFAIIGLYVFRKYQNLPVAFTFIGLSCFLRKSGQIFMIAMAIMYVFENRDMWKSKEWINKIILLICSIVLCMGINKGCTTLINNTFLDETYKSYSAWNMYYMGINEAEFGFQDNDFSYDRDAQDVIDRVIEYGPERLAKILTKKTFWLWTQGTYQAQRYAFGADVVNELDKFEYETFVTKYLLNDQQVLRKALNAFMRAQYYAMFGLMILTIWKKKNTERFRMFYYIIIATFLAMLVYELKSRYILHLAPFMIIMAGDCLEKIENVLVKRKGKE